jgi:sugar lactone lactonase YvrE
LPVNAFEEENMDSVEHVVSAQNKLGEGPIWHPSEQVLYWLDILQSCLQRYDPKSKKHEVIELGLLVSAMGVRAAGGFVMATSNGFALWDLETRQFKFLGDPDANEAEDVRFNDGKTDRQGRFWAGKMGSMLTNSLFRLDVDRSIHRMESGIGVSNGLGWSPDNRVFYYTDSATRIIYAYDFDAQTGAINNRRVFAQIPDEPREGVPDGLAVDEEGCIWSARWGGWKVVRYRPDGSIDREIAMPVEFPTSCAFGGPELKDLYITSAWVEILPDQRVEQPLAGDVFCLKTEVKGFPEPIFQG